MNKAKELKLEIIEELMTVDDIWLLSTLKEKLVEGKRAAKDEKVPAFMEAATTIRENVTFEEILKEQNYQPITYEEFRVKADKIEWIESLDELLDAID